MATKPSQPCDPYSIPLDRLDVSDPMIIHRNEQAPYRQRLREADPGHFCPDSLSGPYNKCSRQRDLAITHNSQRGF